MILTVRQREIEIVGGRTRKTTSQPMSGRWRNGLRFCESERNRYRDATQTSTNEGEWRVFFWVKEKIDILSAPILVPPIEYEEYERCSGTHDNKHNNSNNKRAPNRQSPCCVCLYTSCRVQCAPPSSPDSSDDSESMLVSWRVLYSFIGALKGRGG